MDAAQHPPPASAQGRSLTALMTRRAVVTLAFAAIIALGLGLRLYGLDWDQGFPYTPHPDERAILMHVDDLAPPGLGDLGLLLNAEDSPWNPRWFPYGSFPLYLLKGVQLTYSLWPGVELHDLRIAGRALSALADVGTVMVVFLLGSRMYGRRVGLLAAGLVTLSVLHIQLSHFYAVDTIMALCVVGALYFMYRVATDGRLTDSLLAGAAIGLGVATKVSVAPIFLAFLMAHLLFLFSAIGGGSHGTLADRGRQAIKGLAAGAAASLLVFAVAQPYAFLDYPRFLDDVVEQSEMVRRIRDYPYTRQYVDTTPYWYHVQQLSTWGLGWPLGVLAWAGLLFASLRGMRPSFGLAYLALGYGLPAAVLLYSLSFPAIVVASGISFIALVATLPVRSPESRAGAFLLAWVVPYLLITGAFQVKFIRYLLPIAPVMVLMGSHMALVLWDRVSVRAPSARPLLAAGLVVVVAGTGLYALSYTAIYAEPHPAVRTSEWIAGNASARSVVLKEHWEEGIPNLHGHTIRELPLYDPDSRSKLRVLAQSLATSDYVWFYSNRLYGTIPRLPERYPFSTQYYSLLFSGDLGYELVDAESSYPRLAGVSLVDDTFGRPGLAEPAGFSSFESSGLKLGLGFADESFSVYDHPLSLVFKNVGRHDWETISGAIENAAAENTADLAAMNGADIGLMLAPAELQAQRRGGTWSEIVRPDGWASRLPVLSWLIVVEGISLLALPLTLVLLRPLADRGYLFSKPLGLLLVGLVVWLLASFHWMQFSRASIAVALVLLFGASMVVLVRRRREIVDFVRRRWAALVVAELVFLVAFFLFLLVRMANPDLWHPFRGGEKPMDMAYLNAVLRSSYMPPYDPWFAGGYLNYYYWGQFLVATLIRATGIAPQMAVNLAVPLFFAMTVGGAYTLVFNLAEATRRRRPAAAGLRAIRSPVLAGVAGAVFVAVIGNLDGAIQVGQGAWRALFSQGAFGEFDFWRSTRMMPPDPPGHEITEFPFFTFLFADLHAHLMALPYTLLALGLALAVVLAATKVANRRLWSFGELARLGALGLVVGSLRLINAWDFPTYVAIAAVAVFLAAYFSRGGLSLVVLAETAAKTLLVLLVGFVVFLPFHLNYETFFTRVEPTTNRTVLWQFLAISGLFIFIAGSFFISEAGKWAAALSSALTRPIFSGGLRRVGLVAVGALAVGSLVAMALYGPLGSTIPFLVVMMALVVAVGVKYLTEWTREAPVLSFVAAMVAMALLLAIGLDVFRVEGDIDRMNSVFKFYLQVWVLMALASAYVLWRQADGRRSPLWRLAWGKKAWVAALVVLVASASIYTALGTQDRLRDRFDHRVTGLTLDGLEYINGTSYSGYKGRIDLEADYLGIQWLRHETVGSPVVLEGHTPTYRWGGRISIHTGLPSVVGWQWHQEQQRWDYRQAVGDRIRDVNKIYQTTSGLRALELMDKYGVEYVYIGELERLYYPTLGIRKFETSMADALEKVYSSEKVTIYRVRPGP